MVTAVSWQVLFRGMRWADDVIVPPANRARPALDECYQRAFILEEAGLACLHVDDLATPYCRFLASSLPPDADDEGRIALAGVGHIESPWLDDRFFVSQNYHKTSQREGAIFHLKSRPA